MYLFDQHLISLDFLIALILILVFYTILEDNTPSDNIISVAHGWILTLIIYVASNEVIRIYSH